MEISATDQTLSKTTRRINDLIIMKINYQKLFKTYIKISTARESFSLGKQYNFKTLSLIHGMGFRRWDYLRPEWKIEPTKCKKSRIIDREKLRGSLLFKEKVKNFFVMLSESFLFCHIDNANSDLKRSQFNLFFNLNLLEPWPACNRE